jgi:hypothetical protein
MVKGKCMYGSMNINVFHQSSAQGFFFKKKQIIYDN